MESWRGQGWSPEGRRGSPAEIWEKNILEREQHTQSPAVGRGSEAGVLLLTVEGVMWVWGTGGPDPSTLHSWGGAAV